MRWHLALRPLLPAALALALGAVSAAAQGFNVHGELSYGVGWALEQPAPPQREYRLSLLGAGPLADWLWASAQLDTGAPELIPFVVTVATWDGAEMVVGDFEVQLRDVELVSLRRQLRGARLVLEPGVTPSVMVWRSTVRSLAWEERFEVLDPEEAASDDDPHTTAPTASLKLELSPVLDDSETVRKNGRLLTAPLDYQLDAADGALYFDPALEAGDVVEVSYRVASLSPEPLEGARIGLDLPGFALALLGLDGLGCDASDAGGELLPPLHGFTVRLDPGPIVVHLERWVADEPARLTSGLPPYLPDGDDVFYDGESEPEACAVWPGPPEAWLWELGFGAGGFQASRSYRLRTPGFPTLDDPEAQADWAEEATSPCSLLARQYGLALLERSPQPHGRAPKPSPGELPARTRQPGDPPARTRQPGDPLHPRDDVGG